ncbi:hypothetical protein BKA62DRAFT_687736 [Auriculariales sp. MPI-PUGE-AT-0066]|nr:hypothetical protein BKA62DRAFT_687736 [Auriculariales sp. MPI-PUGE-AT-0066]
MPTKSAVKATRPKKRKPIRVYDDIPETVDRLCTISRLERTISGILLRRFEHDIARLVSAHIHRVSERILPRVLQHIIVLGSPGWAARNASSDGVRDFFRQVLAMDLRQAGERVATKSVLWSYTALRHFAVARGVHVCESRGLHSARLLPHHRSLREHLRFLELNSPACIKPTHMNPVVALPKDLEALAPAGKAADAWRDKVRLSYARLTDSLWSVAREFDVRGYGLVLRDKLTTKWCECGCSTDHLGEVCERTVRDDEDRRKPRPGKEREWDGRGSGVRGWNTAKEEDVWDVRLDFGAAYDDDDFRHQQMAFDGDDAASLDLTVAELIEWRYFRAERQKELGNTAFKRADYDRAVLHYMRAREIEPELPTYALNLAAAHLKLAQWAQAEVVCTSALAQHRSSKGLWRRARARRMLGRDEDAIRDLHDVLELSPGNADALSELAILLQATADDDPSVPSTSTHPLLLGKGPCGACNPPLSYALASSLAARIAATPPDPDDAHAMPTPWEPTPEERRKLRVVPVPRVIDDPIAVGLPPGPSASYSFPTWERYVLRRE